MMRRPGSLKMNAEDQDLLSSFQRAQEVLAQPEHGALDNIHLLRRGNGLPERRHHGPWERREDMVDFHEEQRKDRLANVQMEADGSMVIAAYLVVAGVAFLLGVAFVLLAQWMT